MTYFIILLYGLIGGLSTLALVIGIPATLIWKVYRKATLGISMFN